MMRGWLTGISVCLALAGIAEIPDFDCKGSVPGNIQFDAEPIRLKLRFENRGAFSGELIELLRVSDMHGNGSAPASRRVMLENQTVLTREVTVPAGNRGMFRITYSLARGGELLFSRSVTGAILLPVEQQDPAGSRRWGMTATGF